MSILPKPVDVLEVQGIELSHIFTHLCSDVCNDSSTFDVIRVTDLETVVFKINETEKMYLVTPLNEFERE